MKASAAKQMATAVQLWLDFQVLCGREMLLSEAYLSQPIGEFLRNYHSGSIQTEWNHPNIQKQGRGRPKQIDYGLFSRDKKRPLVAIEAKWINNQASSKQRLLDDVLRLECVRNKDRHPMTRFFVVAGRKEHVEKNLLELKINTGSGRDDFLPPLLSQKKGYEHTVRVKDCGEPWRPFFKSFQDSYNVGLPTSLKTTLIDDRGQELIRVLVWRISCMRNRKVFLPSEYWKDVKVSKTEDA